MESYKKGIKVRESFHEDLSLVNIKAIEQAFSLNFPKSYRDFLINYNACIPEKDNFNFKNSKSASVLSAMFGIVSKLNYNNLYLYNVVYKQRIPKNTFPIADDVFGNLILISIRGPDYGKVYFWDHEMEADIENGKVPSYDNLTLISNSFDEFMNGLYGEEELEEE